jgi:hypothetical protein
MATTGRRGNLSGWRDGVRVEANCGHARVGAILEHGCFALGEGEAVVHSAVGLGGVAVGEAVIDPVVERESSHAATVGRVLALGLYL